MSRNALRQSAFPAGQGRPAQIERGEPLIALGGCLSIQQPPEAETNLDFSALPESFSRFRQQNLAIA